MLVDWPGFKICLVSGKREAQGAGEMGEWLVGGVRACAAFVDRSRL